MSAAHVSKRKGYIGAGVAGLILAAGYLAASLELPFGRIDQPGAGVFPIVVGCVLIAASLIAIWEGVRLRALETVEMPAGTDLRRLLSLIALLIGFVIAIPLLGQLIASVIFCILLMRCLSDLGWLRVVVTSLLLCGGLYVVFVMVLKVPLPGGLLRP